MTRHKITSKPKRVIRKRITISSQARQLGVTREHLSRVLHGHRQSRSLMRRYLALPQMAA